MAVGWYRWCGYRYCNCYGIASSGGGMFYVSVSANNMFTYYTEVESEYASENSSTYSSKTVPGSMVVIVEEKNNKNRRYKTLIFWKNHSYKYGINNTY